MCIQLFLKLQHKCDIHICSLVETSTKLQHMFVTYEVFSESSFKNQADPTQWLQITRVLRKLRSDDIVLRAHSRGRGRVTQREWHIYLSSHIYIYIYIYILYIYIYTLFWFQHAHTNIYIYIFFFDTLSKGSQPMAAPAPDGPQAPAGPPGPPPAPACGALVPLMDTPMHWPPRALPTPMQQLPPKPSSSYEPDFSQVGAKNVAPWGAAMGAWAFKFDDGSSSSPGTSDNSSTPGTD